MPPANVTLMAEIALTSKRPRQTAVTAIETSAENAVATIALPRVAVECLGLRSALQQ